MTSVATKWMSIDTPEGFVGSVERAEVVFERDLGGGQIRVTALRKDAPYSISMEDAKRCAVGGDQQNPRSYDELILSGRSGFFTSRSEARHTFNTVIDDTLTLLCADGFDREGALLAIASVLAGLTINPSG